MGIIALSLLAVGLTVTAADIDLAALVAQAESRRDARVQEVRSVRQYIVRNPRWPTDASMDIRMITSGDGSKRYELLATNAEGLRKTILTRIIEGEIHAAAKKDRDGNVNEKNYELLLIPGPPAAGETCRKVQLVAKNRTRFTFDGHGCVDMNDMAMVRMEGRTTKSMSWLVGRADVVQEFRKVDDLWYSSLNQSTADVRFLGKTQLIIKYSDYSITRKPVITASGNQIE